MTVNLCCETPHISTLVVPMKLLPVIVSDDPAVAVAGFIDTMFGRNENRSLSEIALLPELLVTTISQVCVLEGLGICGVTVVIDVSLTTVNLGW